MSPIESIKRVVEDSVGTTLAALASFFIGSNQFDSKAMASNVNAPILLLHGEKDTVAGRSHCLNLLGSKG